MNSFDKVLPAISSAAILINGIPIALARKGIVLLARGLASKINTSSSFIAY